MFARRVLLRRVVWKGTCAFTRTRSRTSVMSAIKLFVNLVIWKTTCVFTRTRGRTNARFAIKLFVNLVNWKSTCVLTRKRGRTSAMFARRGIVNLVVWNTTCALNISSLSPSSVNIYIYITYSTNQTNFYSRFCVSRVLHHISYKLFAQKISSNCITRASAEREREQRSQKSSEFERDFTKKSVVNTRRRRRHLSSFH